MNKFNTKLIDDYINENNLTKTEFCKKCGISKYHLAQIYKYNYNINVLVMKRIITVINVKPSLMFIDD